MHRQQRGVGSKSAGADRPPSATPAQSTRPRRRPASAYPSSSASVPVRRATAPSPWGQGQRRKPLSGTFGPLSATVRFGPQLHLLPEEEVVTAVSEHLYATERAMAPVGVDSRWELQQRQRQQQRQQQLQRQQQFARGPTAGAGSLYRRPHSESASTRTRRREPVAAGAAVSAALPPAAQAPTVAVEPPSVKAWRVMGVGLLQRPTLHSGDSRAPSTAASASEAGHTGAPTRFSASARPKSATPVRTRARATGRQSRMPAPGPAGFRSGGSSWRAQTATAATRRACGRSAAAPPLTGWEQGAEGAVHAPGTEQERRDLEEGLLSLGPRGVADAMLEADWRHSARGGVKSAGRRGDQGAVPPRGGASRQYYSLDGTEGPVLQ